MWQQKPAIAADEDLCGSIIMFPAERIISLIMALKDKSGMSAEPKKNFRTIENL